MYKFCKHCKRTDCYIAFEVFVFCVSFESVRQL